MSGGVDSSVAAALLVEQGYEVIGVTMQIWPAENSIEADFSRACCSLTAVEDARRVAARLGIAHYVVNFRDVFEETVIHNFIEEYRRGRTPNPCSVQSLREVRGTAEQGTGNGRRVRGHGTLRSDRV